MNGYEELALRTENEGILLFTSEPGSKRAACTMKLDGDWAIFMNERLLPGARKRREVLAHEFGHCMSGAVCREDAALSERGRCETRAWRRAVREDLPSGKLLAAIEAVKTDDGAHLEEIADFLDITPEFVSRAILNYIREGKLSEEYFPGGNLDGTAFPG